MPCQKFDFYKFFLLTNACLYGILYRHADVAELADAPDLGSGVLYVGVQVPSSAPLLFKCFNN